MTTGDHFCTFGILFDINSDASVVAKTYCEVLKLMKEDLDEVLANHRSLSKYGVGSRLVLVLVRLHVEYIISERELKFMFAIIMSSSVRLSSVVCLSSVTFVCPTQTIEIFGNVFTPFGTLAIHDLSVKILRRSSQGNPSVGGVQHEG